ncbi:hypothetical protein BDF19DRAFT_105649 [Syncephalis fuscata]|nr:hypothetical protein BDF19DRAFT_105649 [Syncephalis fuscata]
MTRQTACTLPNPLPISPSASGNSSVDYAVNTMEPFPHPPYPSSSEHRSGLLTPGTGSAAVSPSLTPFRSNTTMLNCNGDYRDNTMLQMPPAAHMPASNYAPSVANDGVYKKQPHVSGQEMAHHYAAHSVPNYNDANATGSCNPANAAKKPNPSILPPITALSLGNVTPGTATPSSRPSPTANKYPGNDGSHQHATPMTYGTAPGQLPSLTAAANAALASGAMNANGYAQPRVLSGQSISLISASAPVTRCSSPRRRSPDSDTATEESGIDEAIHKAFHPMHSSSFHSMHDRHDEHNMSSSMNRPLSVNNSNAIGLGITTAITPATAATATPTSYRSGLMSVPVSPTHRSNKYDGYQHRWDHSAHHPYPMTSRPQGHLRHNSFTDRRPQGLALESGALSLVHPNAIMSTSSSTNANAANTPASSSGQVHPTALQLSASGSFAHNTLFSSNIHGSLSAPATLKIMPTTIPTAPSNNGNNAMATLERLRRRRENHNHVERRRRDHINGTIRSLAALLPDRGRGADGQRRNKGAILESAVDWLSEIQRENAMLREENIILRKQCGLIGSKESPTHQHSFMTPPQQQQQQQEQQSLPDHHHQQQHHHHATAIYSMAVPTSQMPMPVGLIDRSISAPGPLMHTTSSSSIATTAMEDIKPQLPGLATLFTN